MLSSGLGKPFVHLAALELGHSVATRAHEVMMVALPAQAVTRLARAVRELVHDAVLSEQRERPVDGG